MDPEDIQLDENQKVVMKYIDICLTDDSSSVSDNYEECLFWLRLQVTNSALVSTQEVEVPVRGDSTSENISPDNSDASVDVTTAENISKNAESTSDLEITTSGSAEVNSEKTLSGIVSWKSKHFHSEHNITLVLCMLNFDSFHYAFF